MSDEIQLGTKVTFDKYLRRVSNRGRKTWETTPLLAEGVLIGVRTLANGRREGGWEEPWYFIPSEHFRAYLIAYDLRRKPVYVRPADVRMIEASR